MKQMRWGWMIVAAIASAVSLGACARREIIVESEERAVIEVPGGESVIYQDPYEVDDVDVLVPTDGGHRAHPQ